MPAIKQFTISGENKEGALADAIRHLGYGGVNIRSIMISNVGEQGQIKLVVNDPIKAERIFKETGVSYETEEVLAVKMPDQPGALHHVASILARNKINIDYVYPLIGTSHHASIVFKTHDLAATEKILLDNDVSTALESEI
ncbi:ACT domain-containing protein [bacterium]|nr:ACT domain-containing protein [bacterium]